MQHGGKMGQHQQLMGGLGGSSNRGSTPGGPLQQGGGSGGNGMGGRHPMNPYMLQQQQHQQQQAALNMKQQQMHHLELAFKAGLLPKNTNLNVLSICMDSQLTAQYKECLQKYAQTKFALQKLKAQLTLLRNNNHLQSQQMNPQLHRQLSEIMSNIKSYENNLSALEVSNIVEYPKPDEVCFPNTIGEFFEKFQSQCHQFKPSLRLVDSFSEL